jgi:hypothetical protein
MNELIARLAAQAGVGRAVADKTAGAVLGFLRDTGPADEIQSLIDTISDAEAAIAASDRSCGVHRLMGGGLMALGTRLFDFGLGMGEIRNIVHELLEYSRDKIGTDRTGAIVGGMPALSHFA